MHSCHSLFATAMKRTKSPKPRPRASVSFPPDLYRTLAGIATQKKVSIAWVIREAAEEYVAQRWPLFPNSDGAKK